MPDIGFRIKKKREECGLTQEELAVKLGYKSKTTIAKIENGTNDIVQSKVIAFASALNTTPAYLMGWEDEKEEPKEVKREKESLMDAREEQLLSSFRSLNDLGKDKVMDYAADITTNPRYTIPPTIMRETPVLIAAHNDHANEPGQQDKMHRDAGQMAEELRQRRLERFLQTKKEGDFHD